MARKSLMFGFSISLLLIISGCAAEQQKSPVSLEQETGTHWLIGQWEGNIRGVKPQDLPGRTLRVLSVSSDGRVDARWAITGQALGNVDVELDGARMKIVTGANTAVELTRRSDGLLVGTLIPQGGRSYPITLAKTVAANDLPSFDATFTSSRRALLSGEVNQAMASLESQAGEAEKNAAANQSPEPLWQAASRAYVEASRIARLSGQLQRAIVYGEKSLAAAEKANGPGLQVAAITILSRAYESVRNYEKARALIEKGFDVVKQLPSSTLSRNYYEGQLYSDLGRALTQQREYRKAIEALTKSVELGETYLAKFSATRGARQASIDNVRTVVLNWRIFLANAHRQTGDFDRAIEQYQSAASSLNQWRLTYAYENWLYRGMGRTYLRQKKYSESLESFRKALVISEKQSRPIDIAEASQGIGAIYQQTGKAAEAIPYFQKAIEQIESTRSLLESEEYRQSYFEGSLAPYSNVIEALLRTERSEDAFNYAERARSRSFLDVLGSKVPLARSGTLMEHERALQARISVLRAMMEGDESNSERTPQLRKEFDEAQKDYTNYLAKLRKENKEQSSLMSVEPLTIKQVQERLDLGVTMLEYFVSGNNVWLWVVEKDRVEFVSTTVARKDLVAKVTDLRDTIYQFTEKKRFNALSLELFKILIQSALPHIRGKELIIVPHDVLHYLPFQALVGTDNRYLIEKFPIYYLSSASLMQFTQEKRRAMGEKVLAFGNPELDDPKMALQFAEIEAGEIKKLYPQANVLLKKEATEEKAKTLSPQNDIVHFASHAELNEDDPLASAIRLAKSDKEDGRLEVREIFGMDLKASLVVLSACETGLGKLSSGDELVGLTRAFIYAGTPSVVASLWNVEDSSTAQLMASFYKNLKTMTKVEALRQAQLNLIRGNVNSDLLARRGIGGVGKLGELPAAKSPSQDSNPIAISTSHPFFWAPFILVGEGK